MIAVGAKMNPVTLAFEDAALERDFLDEYAEAMRLRVRAAAAVGTVVLAAFIFLDARNDVGTFSTAVRCILGIPAKLILLGVSFLPRASFRRLWSLAICTAGAMIMLIFALIPLVVVHRVPDWTLDKDPNTFFYGVIAEALTISAVHTLAGLRFFAASLTTLVCVAIYGFALFAAGADIWTNAFAMVTTSSAVLVGAFASYGAERSRRLLFVDRRDLAEERAKSESLLHNVLPAEISERLKVDPAHIADGFEEVTILFADIVGFTDLSARLSPAAVVSMLNRLFTAFDDLADAHGLEKIKTIGDAYMVVGGLPHARADHAEAIVSMALGMRDATRAVAKETGYALDVRMGVNTGPVVAGVIGKKKFTYDLWGDAVNTASRMESHGIAGEVQVTEATWALVKDRFDGVSRGAVAVKGKGEIVAWLVKGGRVTDRESDGAASVK